jgi:hypothetical protein
MTAKVGLFDPDVSAALDEALESWFDRQRAEAYNPGREFRLGNPEGRYEMNIVRYGRGKWGIKQQHPSPSWPGDLELLDGKYAALDDSIVAGPFTDAAGGNPKPEPGQPHPNGSGLIYESDDDDGAGNPRYSDRWVRPDLRYASGSPAY